MKGGPNEGIEPVKTFLSRLLRPRGDGLDALRPLWHRTVELARDPRWYRPNDQQGGAMADTVGGRFDAITLVLCAVLLRMEQDKALVEPSVRLTELFVDDMDGQLRESGVGDLVVGKHMGRLMSVLGGRLGALREALALPDDTALQQALTRNATLAEGADPAPAAALLRHFAATLAGTSAEDLMAGRFAL
jgi:cytochrome b pre-mRNA-processing protein 3